MKLYWPGTPAQPAPTRRPTSSCCSDTALRFLTEVKRDLNSAYKSYTAAYLLLLKRRLRKYNPCKLLCVVEILSDKLGNTCMNNGKTQEEICQSYSPSHHWSCSSSRGIRGVQHD